MRHRKKLKKFI